MRIKPKPKSHPRLPLQTFRLRNFKAVRDSGEVHFTPLTVFIGNNGSGKSSLIEGLETFQSIVLHGLDDGLVPPAASEILATLPNVERRTYPGLRHELYNVPEGPTILAEVIAWLRDRAKLLAQLNTASGERFAR